MKPFNLTVILFLISSHLPGQAFFEADGKQIKTGSISRTYNFAYIFADSLELYLADSVVQYSNTGNSIVKKISHSDYNKYSEPSIQIEYFGINGRDSISKYFKEGKPSMIYQTKYDEHGRISYYGMKQYNVDSSYDPSFERFYEYRDSSITTGKIEIQTIYVANAAGDKRFHFRVLSFYDSRGRKIKELRENEPNDPMAQITIYTYNDKDSLISEKVDGIETLTSNARRFNKNCDLETKFSFVATDYSSIRQLVHQVLIEKINQLKTDNCENYFLALVSTDNQTRLTVIKRKPYWCDGRRVIFTTTKKM